MVFLISEETLFMIIKTSLFEFGGLPLLDMIIYSFDSLFFTLAIKNISKEWKNKKIKIAERFNQLHLPIHRVVNFSVHYHCFKHWPFTNNKLNHSMDHHKEVPVEMCWLPWKQFKALVSLPLNWDLLKTLVLTNLFYF